MGSAHITVEYVYVINQYAEYVRNSFLMRVMCQWGYFISASPSSVLLDYSCYVSENYS